MGIGFGLGSFDLVCICRREQSFNQDEVDQMEQWIVAHFESCKGPIRMTPVFFVANKKSRGNPEHLVPDEEKGYRVQEKNAQ